MAPPQIPRDAVFGVTRRTVSSAALAVLLSQAAGASVSGDGDRARLDAAAVHAEAGRHAQARELLEQLTALRPQDAEVRAALGWAALRSGRGPQAAQAFAEALRLRPGMESARLGLGRAALDAGRPEEATRLLTALVKVRPRCTLAYVLLGRARLAAGRLQAALRAFRGAYRSDPTYSEMRLAMGELHARLGRSESAWREYAKVLQVEPKNEAARAEERRLSKGLTRSPEEILPPTTIAAPAPVALSGAEKAPLVRVALGTDAHGRPGRRKAVAFSADGAFEVKDVRTGRRLAVGASGEVWLARAAGAGGWELVDSARRRKLYFARPVAVYPLERSGSIVVRSLSLSQGTSWQTTGDRQLKGTVEIRVSPGGLHLVNALGLEDYLYGVVNGEMPANFPHEALKAQAVIARNHALYSRNALKPHARHGYDLCDGQHCQVYRGAAGETEAGRRAVDETRGLLLLYRGAPAQTPYSSNCGGHTQDSGGLAGWGKLDYLRGRPDSEGKDSFRGPWELSTWLKRAPKAYCNVPKYMHPSHFRWARIVTAKDLEERVRRRSDIGRLKAVNLLRRAASGNVNRVEFVGTKGTFAIEKEHLIRDVFGTASIRSTLFALETESGKDGFPTEFYLYGGGWGHGVGLCQCGAAGRAEAGQGFRMILGHYYPGTYLKSLGY